MKKNLLSLGLAALMTVSAITPAFAVNAEGVKTLVAGDNGKVTTGTAEDAAIEESAKNTFERLEDYSNSEDGVDTYAADNFGGNTDTNAFSHALNTADNKQTEVGVQQAQSFSVRIPAFISLDGAKNHVEHDANFYVGVNADVAGSAIISVRPNLASATEGVANNSVYGYTTIPSYLDVIRTGATNATATNAKEAGKASVAAVEKLDGIENLSGTFPLKEDAGIKEDRVATITLADSVWSFGEEGNANSQMISDDSDGNGFVEKLGTVSVADLSAGTWRNTISWDITFDNSLGH